ELLGLPAEPEVDGRSFAGLLTGAGARDRAHPIFAEKREGAPTALGRYPVGDSVSVIEWPWKLIANAKPPQGLTPPPLELFNLAEDPGERSDRSGIEPTTVARLRADLTAWQGRPQARRGDSVAGASGPPADAALEHLRQLGYGH